MYNRQAAVDYAKQWWNGANPAFPHFPVDCTNFVSQCLLAGGAPMRGFAERDQGWWYRGPKEDWSYSWAVAHSLRWYLETSKQGLTGKRVYDPSALEIGDVIFYDFQRDGRIDHSTIVTSMRGGVPYIHAHTGSSANRPYDYRDSPAYTPNMQYYFFKITVNPR